MSVGSPCHKFQQRLRRQAHQDGQQETGEGADDDVFRLFAVLAVFQLAKAENGFGRHQESHPGELPAENKHVDQQAFQVTDDAPAFFQPGHRPQAVGAEFFIELFLERLEEQVDQRSSRVGQQDRAGCDDQPFQEDQIHREAGTDHPGQLD